MRNIARTVGAALRRRARKKGKDLDAKVVVALREGRHADAEPPPYRDLGDVAGSWVQDPDFDAAIRDQHRIDSHV